MKTLASLINDSFNDIYPKRPVWAIVSSPAAGSNPNVTLFGEDNPYVPISVEGSGSIRARVRGFVDEQTQSYAPSGVATAPTLTNAHNPPAGLYGVYASTQTGNLVNFEVPDNGNSGSYNADASGASQLALYSGIIVGEANWRQIFDLLLTPTGLMFKEPIGAGYNAATGNSKSRINMNADLGPAYNPSLTTYGFGQMCHNRNSGRLLIAQPVAGVNGTSLTFRFHLFDLRMKIGADTTLDQIKAALVACTQTNSGRYRSVDVTLADTSVYWADNTTRDIADTQFVLCDNDEVWAFKSSDVTGGANSPQALFRINLSAGTWLTGTYTPTFVMRFTVGATSYGSYSGNLYGAKHMNSDDNSVIAMYQHSYYYCGGVNMVMVSTKSAGSTDYNSYTTGVVSTYYTLAPSGGAGFVICTSSNNNDTVGAVLAFLPNTALAATPYTITTQAYLWPTAATSTWYGGNFVCKVQPTTEWK